MLVKVEVVITHFDFFAETVKYAETGSPGHSNGGKPTFVLGLARSALAALEGSQATRTSLIASGRRTPTTATKAAA